MLNFKLKSSILMVAMASVSLHAQDYQVEDILPSPAQLEALNATSTTSQKVSVQASKEAAEVSQTSKPEQVIEVVETENPNMPEQEIPTTAEVAEPVIELTDTEVSEATIETTEFAKTTPDEAEDIAETPTEIVELEDSQQPELAYQDSLDEADFQNAVIIEDTKETAVEETEFEDSLQSEIAYEDIIDMASEENSEQVEDVANATHELAELEDSQQSEPAIEVAMNMAVPENSEISTPEEQQPMIEDPTDTIADTNADLVESEEIPESVYEESLEVTAASNQEMLEEPTDTVSETTPEEVMEVADLEETPESEPMPEIQPEIVPMQVQVARNSDCPIDFHSLPLFPNARFCQLFDSELPASMSYFAISDQQTAKDFYIDKLGQAEDEQLLKGRIVLQYAQGQHVVVISKDGQGSQIDILIKSAG